MNIPNLLSVFRLILVPIFTYEFVVQDDFFTAGILLVISGITDCLDGFIARKFNMITNLGKILDPFADKLTQVMTVFCLAMKDYPIMWYLFAFLIAKDLVLLVGGIFIYKKKDDVVSSNWFGKIATIIFYVSVIIVTLFYPVLTDFMKISIAIIIILACVTALLGYIYTFFSKHSKKIQQSTCIVEKNLL